MTSLTTRNRRFLLTAALAFAAFFAVDAYLFAAGGFLRHFGQATQEGQVASKVRRALRQAELADVIFFGSSYIRSGIAGQPFLERGLLPFNYAVSGGGPVYDYFALKRIAPILAARRDKPTLLLELKTDPLMRIRSNAWSEYPQYSAIVRSRAEMLAEAPRLWRNFRDFKMTSQVISSVVVPSSIYRSQAVPLLGGDVSLEGFFYGTEDFSGFSPLYTKAVPAMVPGGATHPPLPLDEIWPGKIEFLRAFLALAHTTGCPVVLFQSPTIFLGRDSQMLDHVIALLTAEFPAVRVLRSSEHVLDVGDFDEGGHANIKGGDETARKLIASLSLQGDAGRLAQKIAAGFVSLPIPDASAWLPDKSPASGRGAELMIRPVVTPDGVVAKSPVIPLEPPGEWVFELAFPELRGRLSIGVSWVGTDGVTREQQFVTPIEGPHFGASNRVFIRMIASQFTATISDYNVLTAQPPSEGRVQFLRLWQNR